MIESIEFHNFRILRDTTLPLGRCNILVGPNGSGKSTVLYSLSAVHEPDKVKHAQLATVGVEDLPEDRLVRVELALGGQYRGIRRTFQWHHTRGLSIADGGVTQPNGYFDKPAADLLSKIIGRIRVYSLDARAIAKPAMIQSQIELGDDGSGLASVLDDLRDTHPERLHQINDAVGRWIPEFRAILFDKPAQGQKSLVLEAKDGEYRIPAADLSQGTLLALALLTLAYLPKPPLLIGLEEPDRGIHPRLLRHVADAIHRLTHPEDAGEDREPVQVVATTHSPYFLDLFRDHPEEIVIANKIDGNVRFERLSNHADINEILAGAPLGEVWYTGILGGVPVEP